MATRTTKVKHRKAAVQKRVLSLELTAELEDWLEAEAEKNFRSAENQAVWLLLQAKDGPISADYLAVHRAAQKFIEGVKPVEVAPKKAWKPMTPYPALDAKPQATGKLKAINGAGMGASDALGWTFEVGGPTSAKVFEIERELAEHVVGNPSLASMGYQFTPIGEYGDWAYFQRTA